MCDNRNMKIAIIDLGSQYCNLILRRLNEIGIEAEIISKLPSPNKYKGIILSGGPNNVNKNNDINVTNLEIPVLGICYGHQLLAKQLGAKIKLAEAEYGLSNITIQKSDTIFKDIPKYQQVWMNHSDSVVTLPQDTTLLARSEYCKIAAFGNYKRELFGVQFHPEVIQTKYGIDILRNFTVNICNITPQIKKVNIVDNLYKKIRQQVKNKSVLFFMSGGVDSTVAFTLCVNALSTSQVLGIYVDNGLMRKKEIKELQSIINELNLNNKFIIKEESVRFLTALKGVTDPEEKRYIIGRKFIEVQTDIIHEYNISREDWLLGQGTIYPDIVESGVNNSATIKTHHNRCPEVIELLKQNLVIEPLASFYKDEVRNIGAKIGLSSKITQRSPFPGPGLAIRCLCTPEDFKDNIIKHEKFIKIPLSTVGVQGDNRTEGKIIAFYSDLDYKYIRNTSTKICNKHLECNRVIIPLTKNLDLIKGTIIAGATLTRERLNLLREADYITKIIFEKSSESVWQFPVILIPLSFNGGESIILRPVNCKDGMTASFAHLSLILLQKITKNIMEVKGIDAVFLDVTDKPPATIEWE